jgi:hypothetical protein
MNPPSTRHVDTSRLGGWAAEVGDGLHEVAVLLITSRTIAAVSDLRARIEGLRERVEAARGFL